MTDGISQRVLVHVTNKWVLLLRRAAARLGYQRGGYESRGGGASGWWIEAGRDPRLARPFVGTPGLPWLEPGLMKGSECHAHQRVARSDQREGRGLRRFTTPFTLFRVCHPATMLQTPSSNQEPAPRSLLFQKFNQHAVLGRASWAFESTGMLLRQLTPGRLFKRELADVNPSAKPPRGCRYQRRPCVR